MTGFSLIPFLFVVGITVLTVWIGMAATRKAKTASDFFVAGRSVNVFWNASAISGEYLSAASFMGIAGMLMKNGYDVLWYPVCYATGYLFLLLFIAGPLRRFGAYTIPDFAEGRFDSPLFRKIAVVFVLFIGFFYTMPQMKGAGVTMVSILGWPYQAGIIVVGLVITFNVALGGMKGITLVQAFQYWAKIFAISAPVFILMAVFGSYPARLAETAQDPAALPQITGVKTVKMKGKDAAPANALSLPAIIGLGGTLTFPKGAQIAKVSLTRPLKPGETADLPAQDYGANEKLPQLLAGGPVTFAPGDRWPTAALVVSNASGPVMENGKQGLTSFKFEFDTPTEVQLSGAPTLAAPNAPSNKKWLEPFGTLTGKYGYPLLYTYSLIIALVCGTAGLPHILVRFYTNPDGRAAKRTTLLVMVMLGAFYVFPPMWGALGRAVMPTLYANNATDSVVIKLPTALENPLLGQVLSGVTSAGAFAAFMSTFSGLLVSMSGALAHDIYGKILRPQATAQQRLTAFKFAAVAFGTVAVLLGFLVESFDINMMVGWAFAIAAASYFPLLLLGSWWRGLTKYGAAIGMLTGGTLSLLAIVTSMLLDKKVLTLAVSPLTRSLLEQPAVWGVPLSLGVMVVVSKLTARHLPPDISLKMLRLHAPEEMGVSRNYIDH